jgi:hypothetical protein
MEWTQPINVPVVRAGFVVLSYTCVCACVCVRRDQLAHNDHFGVNPRKQDEFSITHYAGPVAYNTAGFLDKNKDMLNIGEHQPVLCRMCAILCLCRPLYAIVSLRILHTLCH